MTLLAEALPNLDAWLASGGVGLGTIAVRIAWAAYKRWIVALELRQRVDEKMLKHLAEQEEDFRRDQEHRKAVIGLLQSQNKTLRDIKTEIRTISGTDHTPVAGIPIG